VNFGLTTQSNEITKLEEPILDGTKRREQGRDYQEYYLYGWAGVDPDNGDPLYWTDETKTTTTNQLSQADRFYDDKTATPKYLGSFGFQARYKSLSLSTLATYMFGHHLFESAARFYEGDGRYLPRSTSKFAYENAWRQPGDNSLYPRFSWGGVNSSQPSNSSRWLFEGDYIRFKDVTLGYEFPESVANMVRLSSLRAQLNITNAWTWVADENLHFDPEQIVSGVYKHRLHDGLLGQGDDNEILNDSEVRCVGDGGGGHGRLQRACPGAVRERLQRRVLPDHRRLRGRHRRRVRPDVHRRLLRPQHPPHVRHHG
jgi:hypothetical protein